MTGDEPGSADVETTVESHSEYDRRDKQIKILVENQRVLIENSEGINQSFRCFYESELEFNDINKHWSKLNIVLIPEFDDLDDMADTVNALINILQNLDADIIELLREEGADEDLISLIRDLKLEYGHKLDREVNRLQKGRNWWSNIKTNAGFRSQRPNFQHELTIDYSDTVVFNSDINTTFTLIDHFVRQLQSVPTLIGEDALLEMNKEQIDTTIERLEDLKSEVENYEEQVEEISEKHEEESAGAIDSTTEDGQAE